MKAKKCKQCKKPFTPLRPLQYLCGEFECTVAYANASKLRREASERKKERKSIREAKIKLKTRSDWLKEVQIVFNRYIRIRDSNYPCISCNCRLNTSHENIGGAFDCGHFLSVGSRPNLRFNELNAHGQCKKCNRYLSGNVANYRVNLIVRIGLDAVDSLEEDKTPKHYTIDDLIELKKHYQQKIKELQSNEKN